MKLLDGRNCQAGETTNATLVVIAGTGVISANTISWLTISRFRVEKMLVKFEAVVGLISRLSFLVPFPCPPWGEKA